MRPPSVLRLLLGLFPRRHRKAFGEEIWEVACYRFERMGGGWRAGAATAWDLMSGAVVLRWEQLGTGVGEMGRGWGMDARFVLRSLGKNVGYVATAVVILACAVAANATVYSYVKGTLLSEPGYPEPETLAAVWGRNLEEGQRRDVISGPNVLDMRDAVTAARIAPFHYDGTYLTQDGRPEVFTTLDVSWDFFDILGVNAARGRTFGEAERFSGGERTVLVSHAFWRDQLGADPAAVGKPLLLEDVPHTLLGILPEDFEFLAPAPLVRVLPDDELAARERVSIHFNALGRLTPGASFDQLNAELTRLSADLAAEFSFFEGWDLHAEPLQGVTVEGVRPVILLLVATVLLVLGAALLNLVMLFRVRTSVRSNEISVRAALGAGRARLARVLALEPLLIATAGAVLGLSVTPSILSWISDLVPLWVAIPDAAARIPVVRAQLDPAVALVAVSTAVLGALVLSGPALLGLVRGKTPRVSRSAGRVRRGLAGIRTLVGLELAFTTVLAVCAGLLLRSVDRMMDTDVGLEPDGLLAVRFGDVWEQPVEDQARYFEEVVRAVEAVPGVERAGVIDYLDFLAEDDFARIYFLDRELQPLRSIREEWRRVDAGAFDAAGMRVVEGRGFTREDLEGPVRTAVVNQSFARRHYPDGPAVGQLLSTHDAAYSDMRIVGVVADVRSLGPATPAPAMLYVPQQGNPRGTVGLMVRTGGITGDLSAGVRDAIWSVDPTQPVIDAVPMSAMVDEWVAIPRAARTLVGTLALLAWILSAVGVFGVASYAVRSRRAELGIRLALGSSRSRLEADQIRRLLPVVVMGVVVGLGLGVAAAFAARALLFGVSPLDPLTLVAATGLTAATALVATWLPARQAGRIDPMEVLGAE